MEKLFNERKCNNLRAFYIFRLQFLLIANQFDQYFHLIDHKKKSPIGNTCRIGIISKLYWRYDKSCGDISIQMPLPNRFPRLKRRIISS